MAAAVECEIDPLSPTTLRLTDDAGASVSGTLNFTCWLAPAASWNEALGSTVTPDGNPLIETWMFPVNPYSAFAVITTGTLVVPWVIATIFGDTDRLKSGTPAISRAPEAEWLNEPLVPWKVTLIEPGATELAAVKLIC